MRTSLILLPILFFSFIQFNFGQAPTQIIRGTITDNQSKVSLPGANVIIVGSNPPAGASTESDGQFRITGVKPGRYDLKISFIGYKEVVILSVVVTAGKEVVLDIALEENISSLKEVTISGGKEHETINRMTAVSARSFSMEEANRYSGGRSDPSRLASNFAGVSAPNDSRNDIVIRGNSPNGVLWRIEGLDVPNPNHFVTLGTTGGPVSALNPNVLDNSDFLTSAYPADYGNANAGVFDLKLRSGNTDKHEYMVEMGALTGLEAMLEGPFKKGTNASYLAAYRYSFTGLSQQLGIPIGTSATPFYQDLTFKIKSGYSRFGSFTLFGLGGISHISFLHSKIDTADIYVNPNQDTYSRSTIGVAGFSHFLRLSSNTYIHTVVGITYCESGTDIDTIQSSEIPSRAFSSESVETQYEINTFLDHKFNARFSIKGGLQANIMNLSLHTKDRLNSNVWKYLMDYQGNTSLLVAYAECKYRINEKLTFNGGLRSQYLTLNGSVSLEPRASIKYQVTPKYSISAGYGYNSQTQPLPVYFYRELKADNSYDESNRNLGFTRSQHFVVSLDALPIKDWRLKTEVYYQLLSNVPISRDTNSFSMLNEGGNFGFTEQSNLVNRGTGTNYGIELTIEKFFSRGYYALLTGSLYQGKYKGSDNIERNTAFNGNFVYNILAGKEFKVGKAKRNAITLDARFSQAGGRYYTPVDLVASRAAGKEVLMGDRYAFSQRYPGFMRIDLKAGFTYNGKKHNISQTFYFDVQNITNHKNVFMQEYNTASKQVVTVYQIGFYPNFVYKIQF
jgi:hypothetical protein